jgi:hypothetical protein
MRGRVWRAGTLVDREEGSKLTSQDRDWRRGASGTKLPNPSPLQDRYLSVKDQFIFRNVQRRREFPAALSMRRNWGSNRDGVGAISVVTLRGDRRQSHLFSDGSGQKAAQRGRQPTGNTEKFLGSHPNAER